MNQTEKEPLVERGSRALRDFHLGLGGIALVGAVLFPVAASALTMGAGYEGIRAGFWEASRQFFSKKDKKGMRS
jgi:hypothetical protein